MEVLQGLISVIVPVYNVKEYLNRCMESLVYQTYTDIEILVVDDGSDDGSSEICDQWQQTDRRISVFHKQNGGLSSARNLGLNYAKGEFITFVDSDDYVDLDMYEIMITQMKEGIDIVSCGTVLEWSERSQQHNRALFLPENKNSFVRYTKENAIHELLLTRSFSFSVCDKIFRRCFFERVRFPLGRTSEDLPVVFRIFLRSTNIVNIGRVKYHYVCRENSICRKSFSFRRVDCCLFAGEICREVTIYYPQFIRQAELMYMRNLMGTIYKMQECDERKKYLHIEERLRKALFNMYIRNGFNSYMSNLERKKIIQCILAIRCLGDNRIK